MHSLNTKTRHENDEKNYDIVIKLLVHSKYCTFLRIIILVVKEY
jgi:hypothetical protein